MQNARRLRWDCNHTALHVTAEHGGVELARMLPNIRDDKYHATALGWAEYCGQPAVAALLARARRARVRESKGAVEVPFEHPRGN